MLWSLWELWVIEDSCGRGFLRVLDAGDGVETGGWRGVLDRHRRRRLMLLLIEDILDVLFGLLAKDQRLQVDGALDAACRRKEVRRCVNHHRVLAWTSTASGRRPQFTTYLHNESVIEFTTKSTLLKKKYQFHFDGWWFTSNQICY